MSYVLLSHHNETISKLQNSLISIISKKPLTNVTILDICQNAGLSRSTFYGYYKDKYDLLDDIKNEIMVKLNSFMAHTDISSFDQLIQTNTASSQFIFENKKVFKLLFSNNIPSKFIRELKEFFVKYYHENLVYSQKYSMAKEIYIQCLSTINVYIIRYWVYSEINHSPDKMAYYITNMIYSKPILLLANSSSGENHLTVSELKDRRLKKTRLSIKTAFLTLLSEKNYELITLTEIAENADITRATFYSHYKNKEALLSDLINNMSTGLITAFHHSFMNLQHPNDYHHISNSLIEIFTYVKEHNYFFSLLNKDRNIPGLTSSIFNKLYQYFNNLINSENSIEKGLLSSYLSGIIVGMIEYWVASDMKYPAEYMGEQIFYFISRTPHRPVII